MKNDVVFNTKRMPEKWRRHFKIYRAKISIYLDTPDFGTPLMVDASEMMEFLPAGIDDPSFFENMGPVKPGGESLWIEAELPAGLPSRPNVRRMGAMVHHSNTRTNFMAEPWTGADHEYIIEAYTRDADGLATRLERELRFRMDGRGFLVAVELLGYQSGLRSGPVGELKTTVVSDYQAGDAEKVSEIEVFNRVFFALALMNCRNVSLRERGAGRATKGSLASGDAFHEVIIDGNVRRSSGAPGEQVEEGTVRRHLARGHFKTFTEDAPLLGKHIGTYWWGWQVRGQESQGQIEKTYTLRSVR